MLPFEPRRVLLLLCLLLACTPSPNPSSDNAGQVLSQSAPRGLTASMAAPISAPTWNATGYLSRARSGHTATLLPNGKLLVVGGDGGEFSLASAELYDPATGTWSLTGSLTQAREDHTATLLPGGKVLVVGGKKVTRQNRTPMPLTSAEVYDPATGAWTSAGSLAQARFGHTALMLNGKLLVVAGNNGTAPLASAEVYDLATRAWSPTGSLLQAREHHTATLLPSGKALIVGGNNGTTPLASAEVYDPATGAWSSTASLTQARKDHTATLLPGGKVLVVGGRAYYNAPLASAEEYDPTTGWTPAGSLTQARDRHTAAVLPNGKLLVVGGFSRTPESYGPAGLTELYDSGTGTWSSSASLPRPRFHLTATLLPGGEVLVVGGKSEEDDGGFREVLPEVFAEVYAPAPGAWSSTASLSQGRRHHTATLLPNGRVLVVGGGDMSANAFATAELYDPDSSTWSPTGSLEHARTEHTATLLPGGKVLVVGGYNGDELLTSAELYDPATGAWSSTGSLERARAGHTATLLPDGKVLVVGGYREYDGYGEEATLASAEVYDPATETWSSTGALKQARARHATFLLQDGKLLVLAGEEDVVTPLSSAELYDPVTGDWSSARSMTRVRRLSSATLLPDGRVFVVGGVDGSRDSLASTELYDPVTGGYPASSMPGGRSSQTTTLLPGGKVLVTGGMIPDLIFDPRVSSLVYDLATGVWASAGSVALGRLEHTATLLPSGGVLVVGGSNIIEGRLFSSAELYMDSAEGETRRPVITSVSPDHLEHSISITLTGEHFRGSSEASAGGTQSSPTNYPLLSLSAVESGRWVPLLWHDFSDTSVSATLPYVPNGYYLLNVTTQGRTSSRMISIINVTPPETTLDSATTALVTQSRTAIFSFSSESSASFECNLDGIALTTCTSPQRYDSLREGEHLFEVRARDAAGTVDPTPAVYRWEVDRTRPKTTIDEASKPLSFNRSASARFAFSSEQGASFECSLDGAAFTACSNVREHSHLVDGEHLFQVRATDRAGNMESPVTEYRWTVDTVPPRRPDLQVPTQNQRLFTSRPVFSGTAEPGSTVSVLVDDTLVGETQANVGGYWELTSPPLDWKTHTATATATATDEAGNTSDPSLVVSFATVQRGYYGLSCAAGPSAWPPWPWALALLALGLPRRGRSR